MSYDVIMSPVQRATLDDVARLAGISTKTASRVYAEPDKVAAATRNKVHDAARRLHFRPNILARTLRRGGTSSSLGLLIGELSNPFYFSVAAGIEQQLVGSGMTLLVASTDESDQGEERAADALLSQRVAALLIIPAGEDQSYLVGESHLGTPIVAVDRPAHHVTADSVVLQNRHSAYTATEALLAQGHRRIGYICNPAGVYTQHERMAGYRAAMAQAGITDTGPLEQLADDPALPAEELARAALTSSAAPTAVLAGNNRMSVGVLRAANHLGIPIAGAKTTNTSALSLIGFDDFDTADLLGISVVSNDPLSLGREAAALALRRIAESQSRPEALELPTQLILRGSERAAHSVSHH